MYYVFSILCAVFILAVSLDAEAADPTQPGFKNAGALLSLGQDGQVYLASGDHVLHCNRDGSQPVLGQTSPSLTGATANAQGVIAAGHAHFLKNVTFYAPDFNVVGRFTRIGDYNFTAPADVAYGASGDVYVLDQGRDQVVRFHTDGIRCAVYQIPHELFEDKRFGYLTRFRICEATQSLYVLDWQHLRCFAIDSAEFQFTPKLKWEIDNPGLCMNLSYGYGGFDVDERGILYIMATTGEEFITSYDQDGKVLKKIPLQMGEHHPVDPMRVLGLRVSRDDVFVKRQHDSELFLRFSLATGELRNVATLPADLTAIIPTPAAPASMKPLPPVKSRLGIPANRHTVLRVLFVGNSQVNCVRDIPEMLEEMSRSTNNPKVPLLLCDEVVVGGVGLEGYWQNGLAQQRIAAGGWDYVVFNDIVYSFGVTSTAKFNAYGEKFAEAIRKVGAKTLIFATADVDKHREQHPLMYKDALDFAHTHACRVAGAGMAWLKAWAKEPTLDLHFTDRAHPNALGYYLNACVLYAALTDSNPALQSLSTCGAASKEQATMLQHIAWEQYHEDRNNEHPLK